MPKDKEGRYGYISQNISIEIKAKDSLTAELLAVISGLYFCVPPSDILYTDCLVIVNAVRDRRRIARHENLCIELFELLAVKRGIKIKWVQRERNKEADSLARRARKLSEKG